MRDPYTRNNLKRLMDAAEKGRREVETYVWQLGENRISYVHVFRVCQATRILLHDESLALARSLIQLQIRIDLGERDAHVQRYFFQT